MLDDGGLRQAGGPGCVNVHQLVLEADGILNVLWNWRRGSCGKYFVQ